MIKAEAMRGLADQAWLADQMEELEVIKKYCEKTVQKAIKDRAELGRHRVDITLPPKPMNIAKLIEYLSDYGYSAEVNMEVLLTVRW